MRTVGRGPERLHVRFRDFDPVEQAAVLRLDPIRNRDEYGALVEILEGGLTSPLPRQATLPTVWQRRKVRRSARLQRGSETWASIGGRSGRSRIPARSRTWLPWVGRRALVVDLGSLDSVAEKAIAAEAVLAALWRRRAERHPVLIVIDEAHNVCPREPGDEVTALATEHAARIAAEGRKFGLYLLVSTQRPHRVNDLVVSPVASRLRSVSGRESPRKAVRTCPLRGRGSARASEHDATRPVSRQSRADD